MPRISREQADALRALHWLLSEAPEDMGSGRSYALALALLRHASLQPPGTWIGVIDHYLVDGVRREGARTLLRYIWDLAEAIPAPVVVDDNRMRFRLDRADQAVRRYLFEEFQVVDEEVGRRASPEELVEMRARHPPRISDDERERLRALVNSPPGLPDVQETITSIAQASLADQRGQMLYFDTQSQALTQQDTGVLVGAMMAAQASQAQAQQQQYVPIGLGGQNPAQQQAMQQSEIALGPWTPIDPPPSLQALRRHRAAARVTISAMVLAHVETHPGLSATQIAHAIGQKPASVASVLIKAVEAGALRREADGGPRGGWIYFVKPDPEPVGPTVWQRLKTNPYT